MTNLSQATHQKGNFYDLAFSEGLASIARGKLESMSKRHSVLTERGRAGQITRNYKPSRAVFCQQPRGLGGWIARGKRPNSDSSVVFVGGFRRYHATKTMPPKPCPRKLENTVSSILGRPSPMADRPSPKDCPKPNNCANPTGGVNCSSESITTNAVKTCGSFPSRFWNHEHAEVY